MPTTCVITTVAWKHCIFIDNMIKIKFLHGCLVHPGLLGACHTRSGEFLWWEGSSLPWALPCLRANKRPPPLNQGDCFSFGVKFTAFDALRLVAAHSSTQQDKLLFPALVETWYRCPACVPHGYLLNDRLNLLSQCWLSENILSGFVWVADTVVIVQCLSHGDKHVACPLGIFHALCSFSKTICVSPSFSLS